MLLLLCVIYNYLLNSSLKRTTRTKTVFCLTFHISLACKCFMSHAESVQEIISVVVMNATGTETYGSLWV